MGLHGGVSGFGISHLGFITIDKSRKTCEEEKSTSTAVKPSTSSTSTITPLDSDKPAVTFDEFEEKHDGKIWNKFDDAGAKVSEVDNNMIVSAIIGAILVIILLILGCCCYCCLKRCECDCACDCCMGLGRAKHGPADECKDPKPHYSLNIDEFYDKKGGKNKRD